MNHKELKKYLNMQIENNSINHAQLFYSDDVEEFNDEILQFLYDAIFQNMQNAGMKLDNSEKENIISQIADGIIADFSHLDAGDANTGDVRNFFDSIWEKPLILANKVYIISNFDKLNEIAQNVTLKTLEEPPEYAIIILKASNLNNVLDTVKSRCQKIFLKDDVVDARDLTKPEKKAIGNIQKGQKEKEEKDYEMNKKIACDIIEKTDENKYTIYYMMLSDKITRDNIYDILKIMESIIYENMLEYYVYADIVREVREKLDGNSNFEMTKDFLIRSIWGVNNDSSKRKR